MSGKPKPLTFEISENEFIPVYRPYIDAPEAIQLIIGNTGSAKSGFFYRKMVLFCLAKKYFRIVFTRKVKDTIRDSTFQGLKDVIDEWGLKDYFNIKEQSMDIICRLNGNMMISFGMDDPKKLKSIKDPSHVFWDEFDESEIGDFSELRRRLRTNKVKQTQFWGALNPVAGWWGKEYFFPEKYHEVMPLGRLEALTENTLILKTSYRQNPHVDHEEMEKKNRELATLDENNWTVYEEGNWGKLTTGGEFYKTFRRRLHVEPTVYMPNKVVHLTFDFNIMPYMTMLCAQLNHIKAYLNLESHKLEIVARETNKPIEIFQVRFFGEYCLEDPFNTTEACCNHFIEDYGQHNPDIIFYGDAMGNKRQEGTGNKTEFKKLKLILARYLDDSSDRSWRVNPSVLRRRTFIAKIFARIEIVPGVIIEIIIDPSCKKLIEDLENVKLGPDGKLKQFVTNKKTGQRYEKYNHASDAMDYLITKAFEHYFKAIKT